MQSVVTTFYLGSNHARLYLRNSGRVGKTMPNGFHVYWGLPCPIDQPVEVACGVALSMLGMLSTLAKQLGRQIGAASGPCKVSLCMGMHAGTSLVAHVGVGPQAQETLLGHTPTIAQV